MYPKGKNITRYKNCLRVKNPISLNSKVVICLGIGCLNIVKFIIMEEMDQDLYYFAFSNFLGIGPNKLARLTLEFEDVEKAYYAPKASLEKILGEPLAQKLLAFRESFEIKKEYKKVREKGITVISLASSDYPEAEPLGNFHMTDFQGGI